VNKCKSKDTGGGAWKSEPPIRALTPGNAGRAQGWRFETACCGYTALHREDSVRREFNLPGFGPVLLTQFLSGHAMPRLILRSVPCGCLGTDPPTTGLWGQNVREKCQIEQPTHSPRRFVAA
jgi:hypothetical protein